MRDRKRDRMRGGLREEGRTSKAMTYKKKKELNNFERYAHRSFFMVK